MAILPVHPLLAPAEACPSTNHRAEVKSWYLHRYLYVEYNEKIQPLEISFKSKNIPNDLNKYIFISAINDINYIVEDNLIHISKLKKVNMNNSNIINDQQDSLSEDIRNSVYNELLKKTKISTNDNLINAILKSL